VVKRLKPPKRCDDLLDFKNLVIDLDKELAIRDGDEHSFYDQFNKIVDIKYVVLIYENDVVIGCGAIKDYNLTTMELKRMYVVENKRGKGVASIILKELEGWIKELGFTHCILETGVNQPEAIALYMKNNYTLITNYGQYTNAANSVCFEKIVA
jgi:GNAT superfamily N-acetyltransferase